MFVSILTLDNILNRNPISLTNKLIQLASIAIFFFEIKGVPIIKTREIYKQDNDRFSSPLFQARNVFNNPHNQNGKLFY